MADNDIVLTTYGTLNSEFFMEENKDKNDNYLKNCGLIFKICWWRVILGNIVYFRRSSCY